MKATSDPEKEPRSLAPQITTGVIGILFFLAGLLWCLGGAGIYGSPLPEFGSEAGVILVYLLATSGASLLAAATVFARPTFASGVLKTGAAIGCLLAGRYLFASYHAIDPVAAILSFGVPAVLLLLGVWLHSAAVAQNRRPGGDSDTSKRGPNAKAGRLPRFKLSLRQLLLGTTVVALAITFGKLSAPPSTLQSDFMMDYSWSVPITETDRYSDKENAGEDLRSILNDRYQIELRMQSSHQSPFENSVQTLAIRANPSHRHPRVAASSPPSQPSRPLLENLRAGLKDVLSREGIEIVNEVDRPGLEPHDSRQRGFAILYQTDDHKGLIQAVERNRGERRESVRLTICERVNPNRFTVFRERYRPRPPQEDWSAFE